MNSYLSREEKTTFVRLVTILGTADQIFKGYGQSKNPDKEFMKSLKTGLTWLKKAITYRQGFLDEDAAYNFAKQVSKLEPIIFVPSDKAKKEYEEINKFQNQFIMSIDDFNDWYALVIEKTCKTCDGQEYRKCRLRQLLSRYGVYPLNPEAKTVCQYSYVEAPADAQKLEPKNIFAKDDLIEPLMVENAKPTESNEVIEKESQEKTKPIQDKDIACYIVFKNGEKINRFLPKEFAELIYQGFKGMNNRPICSARIDNSVFAIDTQEIAALHIDSMEDLPPDEFTEHREISSRQSYAEKKLYRVECSCGQKYFAALVYNSKTCCRACHGKLKNADQVIYTDEGMEATVLVDQAESKEQKWGIA